MLKPVYSTRFSRDIRRIVRQGKDTEKLKKIASMLIHQKKLNERYKNHHLKGNYKDCHECHIEPDWLLIYRIENDVIQFLRTGSHADLFKS